MKVCRSIRYLVYALVFCAVMAAASGCRSSDEVALVASDNGRQLQVERGQVIVVTLASNPSTGYRWERAAATDEILVQDGEAEFQEGAKGQQLVGAGGQEVLRFRAQRSGTTELQLVYHRPWETDVEPEETFSVRVTVR
ncbi:MAG: protease inhibitor I42 family protein [Anaerolineae bacterium]|nr:protease inhibitor I42 family protein [Anaerolineae bacterium]